MIVIGHALLAEPVRVGLMRAGKSLLPYLSIVTVLWVQSALNPGGASVLDLRLWLACGLGLVAGCIASLPSLTGRTDRSKSSDCSLACSAAGVVAPTSWLRVIRITARCNIGGEV